MEKSEPYQLILHEVHFVPLRTQSNLYGVIPLRLEGKNKLVVATIGGEIFCLEFHSPATERPPSFAPINFTYIPGISIYNLYATLKCLKRRNNLSTHANDGGRDIFLDPWTVYLLTMLLSLDKARILPSPLALARAV